jgi:hypothetical protein
MLGLHTNVLTGRWREIANNIGLNIIELGKELCAEITSIEMELSPMDVEKKTFLLAETVLGISGLPDKDTTPSPVVW